jgi:hypothetical protein
MLIIYQLKEVAGRFELKRDGGFVSIGRGNRVMTLGGVSDGFCSGKNTGCMDYEECSIFIYARFRSLLFSERTQ